MPLGASKNAPAIAPVVFRNPRRDFAKSFIPFAAEVLDSAGEKRRTIPLQSSVPPISWRFVSLAPRRFSFGFVVVVSRRQAAQHFRRGFKKSLCLWLAYLCHILTDMLDQFI